MRRRIGTKEISPVELVEASIGSVVRTRDRVAGAGYACSARPDLHTICRSFPKIASALSAKVCGGSRSAKILIRDGVHPSLSLARDGGGGHVRVGVARPAAAWSAREIESQ